MLEFIDLSPLNGASRRLELATVIMKFGGTSVANADRIHAAARLVQAKIRQGYAPVVVVSAMAGHTDQLLNLAQGMRTDGLPANPREMDVVASAGEQVTSGLFALALQNLGIKSLSFQGHQVRILTSSQHGNSDIYSVDERHLNAAIRDGLVPVVAGFQGVDATGALTTLGRGGSDTTAVALAATLKSASCEIYTDVDGVYDVDPRRNSHAEKFTYISYDDMIHLAQSGAKVLEEKCVRIAKANRIALHVRSTFEHRPGTWVINDPSDIPWQSSASQKEGLVQ